MSVATVAHFLYVLPDTPHALWVRGDLPEHLHLPTHHTRVEVVGGEIVGSHPPTYDHNLIVQDVQRSLFAARWADPGFPWRCVHTMDLNLSDIRDGYTPDLIVLDVEASDEASEACARHLLPRQAGMVLEVTSRSSADDDRRPAPGRTRGTKWSGYARVGLPYYLLVDRAPRSAQTVLYSDPDPASGVYLHFESWKFGETIRLPEPFGIEIVTDAWKPWDD